MKFQYASTRQVKYFNAIRFTCLFVFASATASVFLFGNAGCSSGNETEKNKADSASESSATLFTEEKLWSGPDTNSIPQDEEGKLISFGRTLVIHTSKYYGPTGTISKSTNGMNCQNCHMDAGTRPYGNNFGATASTYPKFLPRSNSTITIAAKVNECFSRSLNGEPIDTTGKEMTAIVAYINWLGKDVKKGEVPKGSGGITAPPFVSRAADPEKGKAVFEMQCARCHGKDGQGQLVSDVLKDPSKNQGGTATNDDLYFYPPLWGKNSFNAVATLYRLSKFAGFVQNNMPYPMNYTSRILTDEQAWDIAAYVNSRERSVKDHSTDYTSDLSKKPFDYPFPPYADNFSQEQHKFGPFTEMTSAMKKH
jgi:thiosulfate dehydrogenase